MLREGGFAMPSCRCLQPKHFPLAIPSYSPRLIQMLALTLVTFSKAIRSAFL